LIIVIAGLKRCRISRGATPATLHLPVRKGFFTIRPMGDITVLIIEYAACTVVLTVLLWLMVKLQKLDYFFLGLLGSGALASAWTRFLILAITSPSRFFIFASGKSRGPASCPMPFSPWSYRMH